MTPRDEFPEDFKVKLTWIFEDIDKYGFGELSVKDVVRFIKFMSPDSPFKEV